MSLLIPQSKTAMIIENSTEKIERKILAQERKQERFIEQQKIAQRMENLMEKVFLFLSVFLLNIQKQSMCRFFVKHHYQKKMKMIYVLK